ncbi:MBL fold metallo-hydrolase [Acidiphilium sp. JA12-A1]|uniref:MBL fold metallo-hydrolase n=1 Tax=Acidiphilium sp. JA12-A1 TaxID=1464546 RepID=UPI000461357D|nr:MBL fold metallo-hydrolase [Acidiphilium sp. JA12-A1]KDM68367.1 beta-lactamase domain-containing protein [Acidiphilium sp. JA12-A1]
MILRQFLHTDPTAASYLLGCVGKGAGVVVDPLFPIELYLQAASASATPIRLVIDTHLHADHRSAGRALAEAAGAEYAIHESAEVGYACRRLVDGERLQLGNVVLEVLHTPGHTPEHLCLTVTDRTRADEPWSVLGGHTLMVGDVGRTELATDAARGARPARTFAPVTPCTGVATTFSGCWVGGAWPWLQSAGCSLMLWGSAMPACCMARRCNAARW